uniref:Uncharacterized protein n=1 Tax=Streptomyces citricolor TaxID=212427 RepID=A0A7R6FI53_9ACTN|nr:hypothetical protein [Streptomyces citricolor]
MLQQGATGVGDPVGAPVTQEALDPGTVGRVLTLTGRHLTSCSRDATAEATPAPVTCPPGERGRVGGGVPLEEEGRGAGYAQGPIKVGT